MKTSTKSTQATFCRMLSWRLEESRGDLDEQVPRKNSKKKEHKRALRLRLCSLCLDFWTRSEDKVLNLQIEACNNDFLGECVCASLAGNTETLNSHDGYKGSRNDAPLRNLESWIVLDEDTVHAPNRTKRAYACIEFAWICISWQKGSECRVSYEDAFWRLLLWGTEGVDVVDIDDNKSMDPLGFVSDGENNLITDVSWKPSKSLQDISGSYGVNVCGYEKCLSCLSDSHQSHSDTA